MSAYFVIEIDVKDPEVYAEYVKMAPAAVKHYGGKYLVRGGKAEIMEGEGEPKRIVVLEFESVEKGKEWLNSPEYQPARALRQGAATARMILVEGA